MKVALAELFASLPPEWPEDLLPAIQAQVKASGTKIVVLDDDPTGTQTVHDVTVLTQWSADSLVIEFGSAESVVYVLTNSRSMPLSEAEEVNRAIAANLKSARQRTGREFVVVSRSDSTLRGHFPGEVDALVDGLSEEFDGTIIAPFFLEGGRYTVNDIHYVAEGEWLIPAAETPYARDPAFGYGSSNLRDWVSEKLNGAVASAGVVTISLDIIRNGGPDAVRAALGGVSGGQVCVVNAVSYRDLEVFVAGLLDAESRGKRFIYRTAASFVRVRGGISPHELLTSDDLAAPDRTSGGLVVVGSFVEKTSRQVEAVRSALKDILFIEVSVPQLLCEETGDAEIDRVAAQARNAVRTGRDVMICTSRQLLTGRDEEASLRIGKTVSQALVAIVERLGVRPGWMIAKGGITSSDIATQALAVKRTRALGQAIPGVPIWRLGPESRWPGLTYVVFPGNVGGDCAVAEMIQILRGRNIRCH